MKVDVIVEQFHGNVENVRVYANPKDADIWTDEWLKQHGYETYEEYREALGVSEFPEEMRHWQDVEVIK